jgi:hypothetical protein
MSRFSVTVSRSIGMVLGPLCKAYVETRACVAGPVGMPEIMPSRPSRRVAIQPI